MHHLPAVGQNFQEHPSIALSALIRRGNRMRSMPRRHVHVGLRFTSAGGPAGDMYMVGVARSAWHPLGRRIGTLFGWINKPRSTGKVRITSADPDRYPDIDLGLLGDPADLTRMTALFRTMADLLRTPALRSVVTDPFAATHGALAAAVRDQTLRNRLLASFPAMAADGPAPLRRLLVSTLPAPGFDLQRTLADPSRLESVVRARTIGGWHPCGTCRMGSAEDPEAVVEPKTGRVHFVDGLRVIDASVMPDVPRANTNIPTIMLAEKLCDSILSELPTMRAMRAIE